MIWLLDLNYTLVENSRTFKRSPFTKQIAGETYRRWLVDELIADGGTILLITARPHHHRDQTLAHLQEVLGWQPHDSFFNLHNLRPPEAKKRALEDLIFPKYGDDPSLYFGLESNPRTRGMYAKKGIRSCRVPEVQPMFPLIASCLKENGSSEPK